MRLQLVGAGSAAERRLGLAQRLLGRRSTLTLIPPAVTNISN